MAKSTRWDPDETIQVGKDVFGVATELADRLAHRKITAEFLDGCSASLTQAEAAVAGQPVRIDAQKGSTLALSDLLKTAGKNVVAIRNAIQRVFPTRKDLHRAFGLGGDPSHTVGGALSAIAAVLDAAASHPNETENAGIVDEDLAELRTLRDQVLAADGTQEGKKGSKKSGTAARDALLRDVTQRVDRILAAAGLEFKAEPAILARFEDPIPTKKKKAKQIEK